MAPAAYLRSPARRGRRPCMAGSMNRVGLPPGPTPAKGASMFVTEHDGAAPGNDGARIGDPGGRSRRGQAMAASDNKELSASAKGRDRGSPPPRSLGHAVAAGYLHNETTPPRFPACRHMRMCPATGRTITRQHNVTSHVAGPSTPRHLPWR